MGLSSHAYRKPSRSHAIFSVAASVCIVSFVLSVYISSSGHPMGKAEAWVNSLAPWQKEKLDQIALQRKLEEILPSIIPVERACVMISYPAETSPHLEVSASVQVELRESVAGLEAMDAFLVGKVLERNVRGLDRVNMVIFDSQGHVYRIPEKDEF